MPVQRAGRKKRENSRYTLALATAILQHDSYPTNICIQGANLEDDYTLYLVYLWLLVCDHVKCAHF